MTVGGGSAGVDATATSTSVSSGGFDELDLARFDPDAAAVAADRAADLHPPAGIDARAGIELEAPAARPQAADPDGGVGRLQHEVPLAGCRKRRGDVAEEVAAAEAAGDAGAAVLVAFRRERDRAQRRRLRQRRLDEARVEDDEHLIARRPSALRDGLEERTEIDGRESRVAFGEPAEIPELAADLAVGSRRPLAPVDEDRLAGEVRASAAGCAPRRPSRLEPERGRAIRRALPSTAICLPWKKTGDARSAAASWRYGRRLR